MNFIKNLYKNFVYWAYNEEEDKEDVIEYNDICKLCHLNCDEKCECRCHIASCPTCDKKGCDVNTCDHDCHKSPENIEIPQIIIPPSYSKNETELQKSASIKIKSEGKNKY